jgi:Cu-processing system permease protein
MSKIVKYVILDILRSRSVIGYAVLLLVLSFTLFSLDADPARGMLSLLNVILILVPLVSIVFSAIYVYNAAEFIELLVSQPIRRRHLWLSLFAGLSVSLCIAVAVGIGIPLLLNAPDARGWTMLAAALLITVIFVALALLASVWTRDKARGIGLAVMAWLYFTLLFDGIVLFFLFQFMDYPLDNAMIAFSVFNPVDLARVTVLLQMDISALMGATSAVFRNAFGNGAGIFVAFTIMTLWALVPLWASVRRFVRKDL